MMMSAHGSAWSAGDARFLKDDPEGLRHLMDAVDLLADQPRPEGSTPYGSH
ncbi:hypothetical protein ABT203_31725 [Streptomyces sp900105245]|uniref:hypothetical protein n=1 Tax=Streptomyces sp. 900105245 TaxID=3154379 RepID=UPI0033330D20